MFVTGRCLEVFALFVVGDLLHNYDVRVTDFVWWTLALSGVLLLTLHGVWPMLWTMTRKQTTIVGVSGLLLFTHFALFAAGLKLAGPVRALLCQFADYAFVYAPALGRQLRGGRRAQRDASKQPRTHRAKLQGAALMLLAYLLLVLSADHSVHDDLAVDGTAGTGDSTAVAAAVVAVDGAGAGAGVGAGAGAAIAAAGARLRALLDTTTAAVASTTAAAAAPALSGADRHAFTVFFVRLSEGTVGSVCLLLGAAVNFFRRRYAKQATRDIYIGDQKRLPALSNVAGALFALVTLVAMSPFGGSSAAAVSAAESGPALASLSTFNYALAVAFSVLFLVVLPLYVEVLGQRARSRVLTQTHFVSAVVFALALDAWRTESRVTWPTGVAAVLCLTGLHKMLQAASAGQGDGDGPSGHGVGGHAGSSLPLYGGLRGDGADGGAGGAADGKAQSWTLAWWSFYKHVVEDRDTIRIFIFLSINFIFMFVELAYGFWTNSLGLISDAGHMAFDCVALGIGLYASYVSKIKANNQHTYGHARVEILSGYVNGVFLLFIAFLVLVEAVERIVSPEVVGQEGLLIVSVLGLCVNLVGLAFFHDHHNHSHGGGDHGHSHGGSDHGHAHGGEDEDDHDNLNMHGIFLHVLADTLGSVGVIMSSLLIQWYGWYLSDPLCSIFISVLIVLSVTGLIRSSGEILLQRTPRAKRRKVERALRRVLDLDGVEGFRAAHFWQLGNEDVVGTLHVKANEASDGQRVLAQVCAIIKDAHGDLECTQLTVQVEKASFLQQAQCLDEQDGGTYRTDVHAPI